mmetsp:Transcript_60320/g.186735  ORF Transcript_60320/g.186735 Transcript_60320/m.186735 type:complete len:356 (+) Transcript_60320:68-1135(+)
MRRPVLALAAATLARLWGGGQALRMHEAASEAAANGVEARGISDAANLELIVRHAGLYTDKSAHPEFANAILVTASNIAYSEMLRNWRCHADKLGLDYIVIALDPALLAESGVDRTMLIEGNYFPEAAKFRKGHFNELSCAKLRIVKDIMLTTGLDVIFSDPDNVFGRDPFGEGVSLGDKIRSRKYQYIYQQNHGRRNLPNSSDLGAEVSEGNTGFYYVAGTAKAWGVQALFQAGLDECARRQNIDDQTNFWQALKTVRQGDARKVYGNESFACADLCGKGKTCAAADEDVLSYCEMDPWNHATGWDVRFWNGPQQIVTYHANFVGGGMDKKIGKLNTSGFWDTKCVEASAKTAA